MKLPIRKNLLFVLLVVVVSAASSSLNAMDFDNENKSAQEQESVAQSPKKSKKAKKTKKSKKSSRSVSVQEPQSDVPSNVVSDVVEQQEHVSVINNEEVAPLKDSETVIIAESSTVGASESKQEINDDIKSVAQEVEQPVLVAEPIKEEVIVEEAIINEGKQEEDVLVEEKKAEPIAQTSPSSETSSPKVTIEDEEKDAPGVEVEHVTLDSTNSSSEPKKEEPMTTSASGQHNSQENQEGAIPATTPGSNESEKEKLENEAKASGEENKKNTESPANKPVVDESKKDEKKPSSMFEQILKNPKAYAIAVPSMLSAVILARLAYLGGWAYATNIELLEQLSDSVFLDFEGYMERESELSLVSRVDKKALRAAAEQKDEEAFLSRLSLVQAALQEQQSMGFFKRVFYGVKNDINRLIGR